MPKRLETPEEIREHGAEVMSRMLLVMVIAMIFVLGGGIADLFLRS